MTIGNSRNSCWCVRVALVTGLLLAAWGHAPAQDSTWNRGAGSDDWNAPGNWTAGVPTGTARFQGAGAGNVDLLGGSFSVTGLEFTAGGYTLQDTGSPAGSLTTSSVSHASGANSINLLLSSSGLAGSVSGGTLHVTNVGNTIAGGDWSVTGGSTLAVEASGSTSGLGSADVTLGGGTLDLIGATTQDPGLLGQYWNYDPRPLRGTGGIDSDGIAPFDTYSGLLDFVNNTLGSPTAAQQLNVPIDFPSGGGDNSTGGNPFSSIGVNLGNDAQVATWSGQLSVSAADAGVTTFRTASDDGTVIYIDGNLVVQNNKFQGVTSRSGTYDLTEGTHDILVAFYEGDGGSGLGAHWTPLSTGSEVFIDGADSRFVTLGAGDATLGNSVHVTADSTIRNDTVDPTLGTTTTITLNTLSVDAGATLTKTGRGTIVFDQSSGTNSLAAGATVQVDEGELAVVGSNDPLGQAAIVLDGGTLTVEGGTALVNLLQAGRFQDGNFQQDFSASGGAYTDDQNGIFTGQQLLSGTPGMVRTQSGDLSYSSTGAFNAFWGTSGDPNEWQAVWTGYFVAQTDGVHEFRIQSGTGGDIDDDGSLWVDADQSNAFDSGEGGTTGGQRTHSVALTAGQSYGVAFGFNENTGGESYRVQFMEPSGSWTTVNPTAQAGYWQSWSTEALDLSDSPVTLTASSTLNAVTDFDAKFGHITFQDGILTAQGAPLGMSFTDATASGTVGIETQTDVTLGGYNDTGPTTFTKSGPSQLSLSNVTPGDVAAAQTTFVTEDGTLYSIGADPLGQGNLNLAGGTTRLEGAPQYTEGLLAGSHSGNPWTSGDNPGNLGTVLRLEGMLRDGLEGDLREAHWTAARADGGTGPGDTTLIYSGQIYLAGETTFVEMCDDNTRLYIDGQEVLNAGDWNDADYVTYTPTGGAGWYDFDVRFSNGSGGYGFEGQQGGGATNWDTAEYGFGMAAGVPADPLDATSYTYLVEPAGGGATLLRTTEIGAIIAHDTHVELTGDSNLDLITEHDAQLGVLTLTSGTVSITGAPGGLSFHHTTVSSGATAAGLDTHTDVLLTRTSGFDGAGETMTVTKTGLSSVILNQPAVNASGITFDVVQGRLGVESDGATAGMSHIARDGAFVDLEVQQSSANFPAVTVDPRGGLGGQLQNAVYNGAGQNVLLAEDSVLAPVHGELPSMYNPAGSGVIGPFLPTRAELGGSPILYLGVTDVASTAAYHVGDDGADSIFKGAAFGDWTEGATFNGSITDLSPSMADGIEIMLAKQDVAVDSTAVFTTNNTVRGVEIKGEGEWQINTPMNLVGTNQITRTGDFDDSIGRNTTNDYIVRLESNDNNGSLGDGQILDVTSGRISIRDDESLHLGAVLNVNANATLNIDDTSDGRRPSEGTFNINTGGAVRLNNNNRLTNGGTFNIDPDAYVIIDGNLDVNTADPNADPGLDGTFGTADDVAAGFDNVNIVLSADQMWDGLYLGDGRRLTAVWQEGQGTNGSTANFPGIYKSVSADPTDSYVIFSDPGNGDLDINSPVYLDGVDIYVNDPLGTQLSLPARGWDMTRAMVDMDGRVNFDGDLTQFDDMVVRNGYVRLADGDSDDIVSTGALVIMDGGQVELQGNRTNLMPKLIAGVSADTLFPGGIVVDKGGYLELRYQTDENAPLEITQEIIFRDNDVVGMGRDLSIFQPDEEGSDSGNNNILVFNNIVLEEGAHVGIDRDGQDREELRLSINLTGNATIEREPDDFSFQNVDATGGPFTLKVGNPDDDRFDLDVYGTIGASGSPIIELINARMDLEVGSQAGPDAVIRSRGAETTSGADDERIRVYAGRDGTNPITGGTFELTGADGMRIRVEDRGSGDQVLNEFGGTVRFIADGDAGTYDGRLRTQRDGSDLSVNGRVTVAEIRLTPDAYGLFRANDGMDFWALSTVVEGTGSTATISVGDSSDSNAPGQGLVFKDISGEDPGNTLVIRGDEIFELSGTLGIDVAVLGTENSRARIRDGFDLNGRTLTLGNRDNELHTDPGGGRIVTVNDSTENQDLEIWHGQNGETWSGAGLEIEIALPGGLRVAVEEAPTPITNDVLATFIVPTGQSDIYLRSDRFSGGSGETPGTVILDRVVIQDGATADLGQDDGTTLNIRHLHLGDGAELDTHGIEFGYDSITGSGRVYGDNSRIINPGGLIGPGQSAGTLTVGSDLVLSDTAAYAWETALTGYDSVIVEDDLTLDPGWIFRPLPGWAALPENEYVLFTYNDQYRQVAGQDDPPGIAHFDPTSTPDNFDWSAVQPLIDSGAWDISGVSIDMLGTSDNGGRIVLTGLDARLGRLVWDGQGDGQWQLDDRWDVDAAPPTPANDHPRSGYEALIRSAGNTITVDTPDEAVFILNVEDGTLNVAPGGDLTVEHALRLAAPGSVHVDGALSVRQLHMTGGMVTGAGAIASANTSTDPGSYAFELESGSLAAPVNAPTAAIRKSTGGTVTLGGDVQIGRVDVEEGRLDTGTAPITVHQQLNAGDDHFTVAGGTFTASGSDLGNPAADRTIGLSGGTVTVAQGILPPGQAVAHWGFDETSGDTAADSVGGHTGSLQNGPTWTAGQIGGALDFDGSDDFVNVASLEEYFNGKDAISFSAWIRSDATGQDRGFFVGVDVSNSDIRNQDLWGIRYDAAGANGGGNDVFKIGLDVNGTKAYESASGLQTTEWQHVAMVWESGQGLKLYVDGQLDVPTDESFGSAAGTLGNQTNFILGDGAKSPWQGLMDEVWVYDRALGAAEVDALYQAGLAGAYSGAISMPTTHFHVTGDTTLDLPTASTQAEFGDLALADGVTLNVTGDADPVSFGNVAAGDGSATSGANLAVRGELGIGDSPGSFTVAGGDLTLQTTASYLVEIAGKAAGTEHDQLVLDGGDLHLENTASPDDGPVLEVVTGGDGRGWGLGDEIVIVDLLGPGAATDGEFYDVFGNPLHEGDIVQDSGNPAWSWRLSYLGGSGNDVVLGLNSVPEPSTVVLLGLGGLALLALARRRRK